MTRWIIALLVAGVALTGPAAAGDKEEIQAATDRWLSSYNTGNAATLPPYHPDETEFGGLGDLLLEGYHTKESMEAVFAAGFKTDLQWRHRNVKIYGSAAVVTGYLAGSINLPGGTELPGTWRVSLVWIKDDGGWKIVHMHASGLSVQ